MSTEGISYATELPVIQPAQPLHRRSFPICPKCNQSCFKNDGRFVRALNQVYHYQCFVCEDCSVPVADKYYCSIEEDNRRRRKIILCQYHHTKRSESICPKCDQPCHGQRFHSDCIQCPQCLSTNPQTSFYEFNGQSYCRTHYSFLPETRCFGCNQAVLKQFVQHRDIPDKIWHPECYMIYKFWSVKLAPLHEPDVNELVEFQVAVEKTVNRVWIDLSSFEESAANCISDMLLNAASALYSETIRAANQFAVHLEVLFNALDFIDRQLAQFGQTLNCSREASFVCNQVTQFLQLLDSSQEKSSSTITQDLSSLVTGLAQNLKSLIKIGLSTSLRLEQELDLENTILDFLQHLLALEKKRVWISGKYWFKDAPLVEERILMCSKCKSIISKDYYTCKEKDLQWHRVCFQCSVCSGQIRERDQVSFEQTNEVVCCATPDQTFYTCTYVSFLQHLLYDLKLHLSQLSLPPHKKSVAMSSSEANKENNALLGSKRRKSLLGLLTAKSQKSTETNIHLGQIQSSRKGQDEGVRRTFSIGSNRGVTRKLSQRQPISSLFRRQSKKTQQQARRASVFTVDDRVLSWEPIQTLSLSQDYILRHVAAMTLQPLLAAHFSLDEFLDLLEAEYKVLSPSYSSHHPSALWGKLITHIRAKSTGQEHKIFGAPLSVLVNKDKERMGPKVPALQNVSASLNASFSENASIPIFVKSLITTLLQSDMSVEGVFRKNGNIRQLNILVDSIDQLNDKGLTEKSMNEAIGNMLVKQSPIQLSALLKRYLRELPKPLLTFRFYKLFVQCGKRQDSKRMLHMACCLLPKPNRDTMLMIFSCLKWIGEFSATNRMDIRNLARVIAPSVLYSKPCNNDCQSELRQSAHDEILVVEHLIRYSDDMSTLL
ncbi:hypothetical protein G6F56_006803 [Rhizopus delemar]|nr:hypothetical protein G6F56_006803 [Rhizopus delemar]